MRDMTQLPAAIFIIDPKREQLAVHEARRLGIPVIAVTDTNCDPDDANFLIRPTMTLSARSGSSRRELRTRRSKGRRVTKLPRRTAKCRPNRDIRTSPSCSEATTS